MSSTTVRKTACNLCFVNCGLEVTLGGEDGRQFVKVTGDKDHRKSQGYICKKAARLNFYQNGNDQAIRISASGSRVQGHSNDLGSR